MKDDDQISVSSAKPEVSDEVWETEVRERDSCFVQMLASTCLRSIDDEMSVELLRELCFRYALKEEWVKWAVVADTGSEELDRKEVWDAYLFAIRFTSDDVIRMRRSEEEEERRVCDILTRHTYGPTLVAPVRGRHHIEVKIISAIYDVHVDDLTGQRSRNLPAALALRGDLVEDRISDDRIYDDRCDDDTSQVRYDGFGSDGLFPSSSSYANRLTPLRRNVNRAASPPNTFNAHRSKSAARTPPSFVPKKSSPRFSFNPFKKSPKTKIQNRATKINAFDDLVPTIEVQKPEPEPETYEAKKLKVEDRLERFVGYFLKEFEAKLMSYVMLSEGEALEGDSNQGLLSTRLGHVLGGVVGGVTGAVLVPVGVKDGVEVGSKWGERVATLVHSRFRVAKANSLYSLMERYQNRKPEFRRTLVEFGFDVFQSFEMQFMKLSRPKIALHHLAIDVTNRIINHLSRSAPEIEENLHQVLIQGLIFGRSKLDVANLGRRGFEVLYEEGSRKCKWVTGVMFQRVGVTEEGEFYRNKDKSSRTEEFGYRRLFSSEVWAEVRADWEMEDKPEVTFDYEYVLEARKMRSKAKKMFRKLDERDLEDERVKVIVRETKEEMMEGIIVLKGLSRDLEGERRKLARIEENLDKLRIDEYTRKLEAYLSTEVTKNEEMEKLVEKLNEMDEKLDTLSEWVLQLKRQMSTKRNSL